MLGKGVKCVFAGGDISEPLFVGVSQALNTSSSCIRKACICKSFCSSASVDVSRLFFVFSIPLNTSKALKTAADFRNASTSVGNITYTNTATAYNTSSDYRLKDNHQPLTGSGAFIDALKPKTWNWKADGSRGVGFIAHEVQEVSPGSVVGEKDGEQMQAMEYGSAEFIANIIAELQSLRQRVALLEGN